ncbi:UNVERIFIED_ORG: aspartyl-tRNA(Asn)/glutamyl-tRNA(Gln) amidotransferase subunit B [Variovorax paradoxus]|nr:aspartyl-tRNA(Asn)/glutamyl-tRNA(Gln) amidotransferase subunit B [Variovorax paradoxus]
MSETVNTFEAQQQGRPTGPLVRGYEVIIGFETHAQLSTASKIFSRASTAFGAEPNTQACAVDLALPGTLPVMNKGAVERAIKLGLALGSHIAPRSVFARKNYFYPDLPKGYQISQFEIPVVQGGAVSFFVGEEQKTVRLVRAHLEEDAGKSLHEDFIGQSGIDLNRAGTPLLEIVTEPDMRSTAEAVAYAKELHKIVTWIGICDGNMQEGSFRCDANVSVRKPGEKLGTRREIKNLNSFKFMQQAIDYEIRWQIDEIEDGREIEQATVLFDPDTGETRAMRAKEDSADYRYFPDPDLPPLVISEEWKLRVESQMPELPDVAAARLQSQFFYTAYEAAFATRDYETYTYVCALNTALTVEDLTPYRAQFIKYDERRYSAPFIQDQVAQFELYRIGIAWAMNEVARRLNDAELNFGSAPVSGTLLATLLLRLGSASIAPTAARQVFEALWTGEGSDVDAIIEAKDLKPMNDAGALDKILDEVIAKNAKNVEEYRGGKEKALNALVGQVMKASGGKANPAQVTELLKAKLS